MLALSEAISCEAAHRLQSFRLSEMKFERDLYVRVSETALVHVSSQGIEVRGQGVLSFDTFFNAFFEANWSRYADLDEICLTGLATGSGQLLVYRTAPWSGRVLLTDILIDGDKFFSIDIPQARGQAGRLHLEVRTSGPSFTLSNAAWMTRTQPKRWTTLSVAICTFNKVDFVERNLASLLQDGPINRIDRIIVVDQGETRLQDSNNFRRLCETPAARQHVKLIEQDNFGGSGGFARAMIAAWQEETSSHILLMDDDIIVDAGALDRMIALLDYARDDIAVGGSMIDLLRPTILHADAEVFDYEKAYTVRQSPADTDLTVTTTLDALGEAQESNYNGWFLCCIPRTALNRIGLPLPYFVRSEDCEYGTRLTAAGVTFARLPGISVWHEPFYSKPRAWIEYYCWRNHLITASMHPGDFKRRWIGRYCGAIMHFVQTCQYDTALALVRGVEDYLKGPSFNFADPRQRHAAVSVEFEPLKAPVASFDPQAFDAPSPRPLLSRLIPDFLGSVINIVWHLLQTGRHVTPSPIRTLRFRDLCWRTAHGSKTFGILSEHSDDVTILRVDGRRAFQICLKMLWALVRWRFQRDRLARLYREQADHYRTLEFWKVYLRLDDKIAATSESRDVGQHQVAC